MKPVLLLLSIFLISFLFVSNIFAQIGDAQTNQITIRSDGVFILNGQPFFPIMVSHELGGNNFDLELKKTDGTLYGFNIINLHKQVKFMYSCYLNNGENCRNIISGDLSSGGHYSDILGNMNWTETWQNNANRIFNYLNNSDGSPNVFILSDDYAFMTSTNSHFVQNCGLPPCGDFVELNPITQSDRNQAIDRINTLASQSNSKLIGFFSMDDANMMGTWEPFTPPGCEMGPRSYYSNYYVNNIDQQISELTATYNYAKNVYPNSMVYMAAPPVFYPRAIDPEGYWGGVPLSEIRTLWKDAAHRLAGSTDVMYAMFYDFETWDWNWRIYDGPGYPSWYLEHLNVMKNEVISGYRQPKAIFGGYWMDGLNFLPFLNSEMPNKLKWATYVSLLKGATGLNFFGWHYKDYTPWDPRIQQYVPIRPFWDYTRELVDTLANIKNLDELVFTKTNSGAIGHSLTGSVSQNVSYAVYKINNWNEYYLLVTNNPNGSLNGIPEANNTVTINTDVNLCLYDIKEVFSNNTVTPFGYHYFNYIFPWFGTALFHIKLKNPLPNDCPDEKPGKSENLNIPDKYFIDQNYPNPFNPSTEIHFGLPKNDFVRIDIYNSIGQLISTITNEFKNAGFHSIIFDGSNLASGVYIYKISAGNYTETKKMLLIK